MDTGTQLENIKGALTDWIGLDGAAFIAADPVHMWEMAWAASNKLRIIVCCAGEDIRGDFGVAAALGRVDRHFQVLVTRGRSFTADRGQGLTQPVQNAQPLFQMVEGVREVIRSILNVSAELPVDYRGYKTFPMEAGIIMDAYMIEFSCAADLPQILAQPEETAAIPT